MPVSVPHFLRVKYGPPVIVVAGVAVLAIGAVLTRHLATGIIGAALVILGTAAAVARQRSAQLRSSRDDVTRVVR